MIVPDWFKVTCTGCPWQVEGEIKGVPFYFRYRWGYASLKIGGHRGVDGQEVYCVKHGHRHHGFFTEQAFFEVLVYSYVALHEWFTEVLEDGKCEGCFNPATGTDSEGVGLCYCCAYELAKESNENEKHSGAGLQSGPDKK